MHLWYSMYPIQRTWHWNAANVSNDMQLMSKRLEEIGAIKDARYKWSIHVELLHMMKKSNANSNANAVSTASSTSASADAAPLSAAGSGSFSTTTTTATAGSTLSTTQQQQRQELYRLRNTAFPHSTFIVMPNACIKVGAGVDTWIDHLGVLTSKSSTLIEGDTWHCGDFIVRLGMVRAGKQYLSTIYMEIQYLPCVLIHTSTFALIGEFAAAICTSLDNSSAALASYRPTSGWPLFADFSLGTTFTAEHASIMTIFALSAHKANTTTTT